MLNLKDLTVNYSAMPSKVTQAQMFSDACALLNGFAVTKKQETNVTVDFSFNDVVSTFYTGFTELFMIDDISELDVVEYNNKMAIYVTTTAWNLINQQCC